MKTEIFNITLKGEPVENKGSSSLLADIYCPTCGKEMNATLESHDMYKMYVLISCDDHPLVVWEDVFDKPDIDVSQDWTNRDARFKH
jgi:hypothetical protein